MVSFKLVQGCIVAVVLGALACASSARLPVAAGIGAHPTLPPPDKALIPLVHARRPAAGGRRGQHHLAGDRGPGPVISGGFSPQVPRRDEGSARHAKNENRHPQMGRGGDRHAHSGSHRKIGGDAGRALRQQRHHRRRPDRAGGGGEPAPRSRRGRSPFAAARRAHECSSPEQQAEAVAS